MGVLLIVVIDIAVSSMIYKELVLDEGMLIALL